MTTTKITEILELLNDGRWHMLLEIKQKTKVDENRIEQIVEFLKEYNLIVLDEVKKRIRLELTFQKFLTQTITP